MKILFDFDGVLVDNAPRYWAVYTSILKSAGYAPLPLKNYWSLKKKGLPNKKIIPLTCPASFVSLFENQWLRQIEQFSFLRHEKMFRGARPILSRLSKTYPLYLVSLRQHPRLLHRQLRHLDVHHFFKNILSQPSGTNGVHSKTQLLKKVGKFSPRDLIVGDTEVDILSGKKVGIRTCAVSSGIREATSLKKLRPDYLVTDITKILELLE